MTSRVVTSWMHLPIKTCNNKTLPKLIVRAVIWGYGCRREFWILETLLMITLVWPLLPTIMENCDVFSFVGNTFLMKYFALKSPTQSEQHVIVMSVVIIIILIIWKIVTESKINAVHQYRGAGAWSVTKTLSKDLFRPFQPVQTYLQYWNVSDN